MCKVKVSCCICEKDQFVSSKKGWLVSQSQSVISQIFDNLIRWDISSQFAFPEKALNNCLTESNKDYKN